MLHFPWFVGGSPSGLVQGLGFWGIEFRVYGSEGGCGKEVSSSSEGAKLSESVPLANTVFWKPTGVCMR